MKRLFIILSGAIAGAAVAHTRHRLRLVERLAAATFETLLNAVDANDAVTGAHARRVASYALILADAAQVDERACKEIERVALFHDIGKIHAALFDIIHDEHQLTPEERRAIATHPARGAEVLAPLAAFYPTLPSGVIAHHERWDGKGYPRCLRGMEIPLASRVVAIVDTFDAITASRRYHHAENLAKAVDVIRQGRGTQFDPVLTDRFLESTVLERIAKAMHEAHVRSATPPRRQRQRVADPGTPDVSFRWRDRVVGT